MRLIDADKIHPDVRTKRGGLAISQGQLAYAPTVEAIPKDNVYKAIQEMMKYEHEGFINISLSRLDEILKTYGVCEDGKID